MAPAAQTGFGDRRADIDSLRVLALALLIIYHVLLIFSGHEIWRVNSSHHGYWADYLIGVLTPWRMSAVFFIGGVAVRFMLSRPSYGAFIRERTARLMVAFAFAVAILVPPQRYVRLDAVGGGQPDYLSYLLHEAPYATSYLGLHVPQFAHAWFLPYLFAYSALIGAWWWFARRSMQRVEAVVAATPAWAIVLGAMALFAYLDVALMDHPYNRMLFDDFSAHAKFVPVFALGVFVGKSATFWAGLDRLKYPLWAMASALLVVSVALEWLYLHDFVEQALWVLVRGLYGGVMLFGVAAFAQWALNRPSKALTYASDAILPVYLLHQTVLILIADAIVSQHWPLLVELSVLLAAASVIPLAIYHGLIRHTPWLRFLFGLRPHAREHAQSPPGVTPAGGADLDPTPPARPVGSVS